MRKQYLILTILLLSAFIFLSGCGSRTDSQTPDPRLDWWREARFGMFIHWGLYAIPAGEWNGDTNHAEWIRHTARIPVEEYDLLRDQFNPIHFDADEWVSLAKEAGMRYIVITTKHHDGFCLFDSRHTDFDIASTSFGKDIMKPLSGACASQGLKMGWYHSIMDWHHPDYIPGRDWEDRGSEHADFGRYVTHLKDQVKELLTNYGPVGVMWFDGEWEDTWDHDMGKELYDLCRKLQPDVIVNNRVDKGRGGMAGLTTDRKYLGDFGTPEQEIPATGLPGVDWETCMTMNDHWGYNKRDKNFKSSRELIQKLADITSKGGNFLLNVGPKADGRFPQESIILLKEIGKWMKINGEAIYGTEAGPFGSLAWGRCTKKSLPNGDTRLFLHVFDWPEDGALKIPGIFNKPLSAELLAQPGQSLPVSRVEDAILIGLPAKAPDEDNSVVILDVEGQPDISDPPEFVAENPIFIESMTITIKTSRKNVNVHYTVDGREPDIHSPEAIGPVRIDSTTTLAARLFRDGLPMSGISQQTYTRVDPLPSLAVQGLWKGLWFEYVEGDWDSMPDFDSLKPVKTGWMENFSFHPRNQPERFGFRYTGFIRIPRNGVYTFYTNSDDGSVLDIGMTRVVDNDGLHGPMEKSGVIALARGFHPIMVGFFEKTGGDELEVMIQGPGMKKQRIPTKMLYINK